MCWVEKIIVFWAVLIALFFLVLTGGDPERWELMFQPAGLRILAFLVFVPWIILRLVDWISGGPSRRHRPGRYIRY